MFGLVHVAVLESVCLCVCAYEYRRMPAPVLCVCMCVRVCVCVCVCQSRCALIQYSNAPMALLHQGNIKSSSITASPCLTNCSGLHRLRTGLNHQAGERFPSELPSELKPWASYSATLPLHKAWYLMHRCGGRRWWTGGRVEADAWLAECTAVKTDPRLQRHMRRDGEGAREKGEAAYKEPREVQRWLAEEETRRKKDTNKEKGIESASVWVFSVKHGER